ncbi:aminomethyltransferase [Novimethylophilus kurashikiensis]|uniref:Aminomethyltransferase n=1 Tax=Novimethylophilus kurashikiensis TaxID=1825523 RepID=A0A2R5F7G1_9PROT|nr:glycine cleavage system aminomethyltransferase GcvT [Novimethylophilus kurashikiensis]GBG12843.1 aminomethyltransferase [Novimethylophilus kurashikiensis]
MQKTVLNESHRKLGAHMVDFGGWEMPLHYGSQIEEHHAVRRDCGMFDVSHMCAVDIVGDESHTFLRGLLANDVQKLKLPGKALYSVMLNDNGGVVDDLIVYRLDDTHFRLVVNAATTEKDLAWMVDRLEAWKMNATVAPRRDLAMLAVQGPNARERVWQAIPDLKSATRDMPPFFGRQVGDVFVGRTGYTGEDGFEISLPAVQVAPLWERLLALGVAPCGLGARDTLRLEAGMSLYGQDMDEATSPLDAGLAWTVDINDPRDFVGKAALQRRGQTWLFAGLVLLERGVLRAHQKVETAHGMGLVTSGTFSPTMQRAIGLARLPPGVTFGNTVRVEIRDRLFEARVVKPPFVRHGTILV